LLTKTESCTNVHIKDAVLVTLEILNVPKSTTCTT